MKSKDDIIPTRHSLPIQNIWRQFLYHFHVINSEEWLSEVYWTKRVKQNCGPEYYTPYRIRTSTMDLTHVTGTVMVRYGISVRPQQRPIFRKNSVSKLWKVGTTNLRQIRVIIRSLITFNKAGDRKETPAILGVRGTEVHNIKSDINECVGVRPHVSSQKTTFTSRTHFLQKCAIKLVSRI